MPQINLLKQKTSIGSVWQGAASVFVKLLALLVLVLAGYYVWQFVKISRLDGQIAAAQQDINQTQQSVSGVANREQLYTRQAQLSQLDGLIGKHLYWSKIFPALAGVTLKQAAYRSLNLTKQGQLTVTVSVPDLNALDKFLQVFDQPEFNQNFYNLRLGAYQKTTDASGKETYSFDARLDFDPALLSYQNPAAKTNK